MKLLMSARDVGAAAGMGEVFSAAQADPRFTPHLIAMEPALGFLRCAGYSPDAIETLVVASANDRDIPQLRHVAQRAIATYCPDAILAGLSGDGAGIDEALIAEADHAYNYVLQDFWGDVNLTLGCPASTYFVIDKEAARLTLRRTRAQVLVVGSAKHARYDRLEPSAMRESFLKTHTLSPTPLLGTCFSNHRLLAISGSRFGTFQVIERSLKP